MAVVEAVQQQQVAASSLAVEVAAWQECSGGRATAGQRRQAAQHQAVVEAARRRRAAASSLEAEVAAW